MNANTATELEAQFGVLMFDAAYPPPVLGGKEKQAHLLTRQLTKAGLRTHVLTFARAGRVRTSLWDTVKVTRVPRGIYGIWCLGLALVGMRRQYRLLHIHTPSRIGVFVLLLGRIMAYRVLFKIPNEGLFRRREGWWAKYRHWAICCADRLVVLEDDTAMRLRALGVPEGRILRADNGVECGMGGRDVRCRRNGCLRLLFAGRLWRDKRACDIVWGLARAREMGVNARLDILGDGPERSQLEALSEKLGVAEGVRFVGRVDDVRSYMARADALVVASTREGMPNVVLEAMSVGLPVIASRVGAIPSMLPECGREWIFEPGDRAALTALIGKAYGNRESLAAYGEELRRACEERFDISAVTARYANVYGELLREDRVTLE